jgi:hypothetical protein
MGSGPLGLTLMELPGTRSGSRSGSGTRSRPRPRRPHGGTMLLAVLRRLPATCREPAVDEAMTVQPRRARVHSPRVPQSPTVGVSVLGAGPEPSRPPMLGLVASPPSGPVNRRGADHGDTLPACRSGGPGPGPLP